MNLGRYLNYWDQHSVNIAWTQNQITYAPLATDFWLCSDSGLNKAKSGQNKQAKTELDKDLKTSLNFP